MLSQTMTVVYKIKGIFLRFGESTFITFIFTSKTPLDRVTTQQGHKSRESKMVERRGKMKISPKEETGAKGKT